MEYFEGLDPILKSFWFAAIPASIIFIIQTIMTFMGADGADGTSADFDGDLQGGHEPFHVFTFRNLVNFMLGFSWTGISFFAIIENKVILIAVSLAVGVGFVFLFFFIIRQLQHLAEDNSFKMTDAINKTAEVYLSIPANRSGKGKVIISVKGSVRELDAMTENGRIETGATVTVIKIENNNILFVEKV